jgi:hypothetical protein
MSGLQDDWQRALKARRQAENRSPDQSGDLDDDATTPRGHDATDDEAGPQEQAPAKARGSKPRGPRQAVKPKVTEARAMTVRMEPDEADDVDRFVLDLRDETGQRLDKAEVVRELLRLAQHNPSVRRALVKRLR